MVATINPKWTKIPGFARGDEDDRERKDELLAEFAAKMQEIRDAQPTQAGSQALKMDVQVFARPWAKAGGLRDFLPA